MKAQICAALGFGSSKIQTRFTSLQYALFAVADSKLYNVSVQQEDAMTIETTYSQAREQLKTLMDRAVDDREVVIVRRRSGDAVAMIAADELQSLMETAHLLRSPKNAERLLAALARARADGVQPMSVEAVEQKFGLKA